MKKPESGKKKVNAYLKYSGIGFQLAGLILIGIFAGQYIDENWLQIEVPVATILLLLIFFGGFMYKLIVDLGKTDSE